MKCYCNPALTEKHNEQTAVYYRSTSLGCRQMQVLACPASRNSNKQAALFCGVCVGILPPFFLFTKSVVTKKFMRIKEMCKS
jgi:hypothetical protein